MKLSLQWLRDYLPDLKLSATEIAQKLTSVGLEVEHIDVIDPLQGQVVVGTILSAEKHPQADTLQVCQVSTGSGDPLTIVCGAKNARKGLKVIVATVGSTLPKDFKIKEAKIRGVPSFGMLCSEEELGLAESSEGILELPADAPLGTSISDYLNLKDTVLTLGITPNRGDCLGMVGIARELAAKLQLTLKLPDCKPKRTAAFSSKDRIAVELDTEDAARFTALAIDNVAARPSPLWLRQRLIHAGMRPVNCLVDVTNYVMLESGQPIHAYDARDLASKKLGVRFAKATETLTTLDGQERKLTAEDLVITDGKQPVGLAGVMGGANSEVKADTTSIVVEVAHFAGSRVRKTAKRFALHSEASHRFERGVDVARLDQVAWRVAKLLEICHEVDPSIPAPAIAKDIVDVYPEKFKERRIALRSDRLKMFLKYPMDQLETSTMLERLGITCLDRTDGRAVYQIPTWRHDLEREVDLIEEIARLRGYDKIAYSLPRMEIGPNPEDPIIDFVDDVKVACAVTGFTEVVNFPFMHVSDLERMRIPANHPFRHTVRIANPLAEQDSLLVTTLLPSLLKAAERNHRVGDPGVALFEVGRRFLDTQNVTPAVDMPELAHTYQLGRHITGQARDDKRVTERQVIAGILTSPMVNKGWHNAAEQAVTFFDLKGMLESLALALGIPETGITVKPASEQEHSWLHPGAAAALYWNNQYVGSLGEVHPETAKAYGFNPNQAPVVFECDLELLFMARKPNLSLTLTTQKFPGSSRDLAFIADASLKHEDVMNAVAKFAKKKHLVRANLFDIYTGSSIAAGKKSMAYGFFFQSPSKTLTDKEVEDEFSQLTVWLKTELALELRM